MFKNIIVEKLKKSIKNHIRLCTYNKTNTMQLWTCAVIIKFKNIKKCVFFVVLGNGQVLLGMPDATSLNVINVNIHSVQAEIAEGKTNTGQETQIVSEGCTNRDADAISKQNANGQKHQKTTNKPINCFLSSNNTDAGVTLQLHIVLQLYAYIIIQLHIIHQRSRIIIVYHTISEVIQNKLICIIRFHGVDMPILFQWEHQ